MREIPLSQGKVALVDDEDYDRLTQHKWSVAEPNKAGKLYAVRSAAVGNDRITIQMHREIAGTEPGFHTDHRDGDGLNNQKSNLRTATCAQNGRNRGKQRNNSSGFKGVFPSHPNGKTWVARIRMNGKPVHLGSFLTPEDAARAYDEGARLLHGEFASLNFPVTA